MILVTGAAGLNGSTIAREFAGHKAPVRVLVRSRAQARVLHRWRDSEEPVRGRRDRPDGTGAEPGRYGPSVLQARVLGYRLMSVLDARRAELRCRFWAPPNDYLVSAPIRPHEEGAMKYLCLPCIEEKKVDAMSKSEVHALVDAAPDDEEETARDAREEMGT